MASTLETWSWIAAITAVPVAIVLAVIGWFVSAKRKTNKSIARGGAAISGDVYTSTAGIVTGHNSPVTFQLAPNEGSPKKAQVPQEHWDVNSFKLVARYFGPHEPDEVTIRCQSLSLFDAKVQTIYVCGMPQGSQVLEPAFILTQGVDSSVIRRLTWMPTEISFLDPKSGKEETFHVRGVDVVDQSNTAKFFVEPFIDS